MSLLLTVGSTGEFLSSGKMDRMKVRAGQAIPDPAAGVVMREPARKIKIAAKNVHDAQSLGGMRKPLQNPRWTRKKRQ